MREIKFRSWAQSGSGFKMFDNEEALRLLYNNSSAVSAFQRKDAVFMQFTGLKDKNGVDIYEGDIIKVPSEDFDYCLCYWNEKNCCFQIDGFGRDMYFNEGGGEEFSNDLKNLEEHVWVLGGDNNIEVIGNIYQNPELIKL